MNTDNTNMTPKDKTRRTTIARRMLRATVGEDVYEVIRLAARGNETKLIAKFTGIDMPRVRTTVGNYTRGFYGSMLNGCNFNND